MPQKSPTLSTLPTLVAGVIAAISLLGATVASAQTYELHWPFKTSSSTSSANPSDPDSGGSGDPADPAAPVTLSLTSATLPAAMVTQPYFFDFGSLLTIDGDNPPALSAIYWLPVTGLPPGLTMTDTGVLSGTPTTKNESGASFEVVAEHEGVEGRRVFTIVVGGAVLQVTQISAGWGHTCAVTTSGAAKCWGNNGVGQLGDGTNTSSLTPVDVSGLGSGVASISAGRYHTCVVTTSGAAKCWGINEDGQLGDGTTAQRNTPLDVVGLGSGVASISTGHLQSCVVTTSGAAKCWGFGALGDGTVSRQLTPVDVSGLGAGVASISAADFHTCAATTSGAAKCWGDNSYGQLGDGTTTHRNTPVDVVGLGSGVASISAGHIHTCVVTTSGAAKCWGRNSTGQLGDGTMTQRDVPVAVSGLSSGVAGLTTGVYHTCAVTTLGAAKCWGYNFYGQIGDGTATDRTLPTDVAGLGSGVTRFSAGGYHSCVVTTSGAAKCWGHNNYGQLGEGTTTGRLAPVDVLP
jgi:alpha-tubulin suppressor-like RCC1 family protein